MTDRDQPEYLPIIGFQPSSGYLPQEAYAQSGYPQTGDCAQNATQGVEYPSASFPAQITPYQPNRIPGGADNTPANNTETEDGFMSNTLRKAFIILIIQLIITIGIIAIFLLHRPTKLFALGNTTIIWIFIFLLAVVLFSIGCSKIVRHTDLLSLIYLGLLTVAVAYLCGFISIHYEFIEILLAFGIAAVACLALITFAFKMKWDFTTIGSILFVCLLNFVLLGIISKLVRSRAFSLVYSSFGVFLFLLYLVYDTQLMLGGNHKYSISPEDYVLDALNLYIDNMQIFLQLLRIIGATRN